MAGASHRYRTSSNAEAPRTLLHIRTSMVLLFDAVFPFLYSRGPPPVCITRSLTESVKVYRRISTCRPQIPRQEMMRRRVDNKFSGGCRFVGEHIRWIQEHESVTLFERNDTTFA